jgi:type IX secretion system PorP/SprF family membrane protein
MLRFLLIFPLILLANFALAQQDPQYSQYMHNIMAINPGYAGSEDAISATLLHREQWVGWDGAPSNSVFHVNSPFKLFNASHGVGVTIINDNLGFNKDIGGNVAYAYRFPIKNIGKLGIGISAGFQNKALDAKWDTGTGTGTAPASDDPSIPTEKESVLTYDISFGVFYKTENLFFGLSSTHITQPKVKYKNDASYVFKPHFYLTSGYSLTLPNPAFELKPSILIATDLASTNFDISSIIMYNKKLWGGVSYRPGSAIIGMVGIELFNGVKIGYSYDYTFTDMRKYQNGSHELMVSYSFTLIKERIPHKYKSVRFL